MKRLLLGVMLSILALTTAGYPSKAKAQTSTPSGGVRQLFDSMTPEERVGQLFLVTFTGTDTTNKSQIYDLIVKHNIGGVVLRADNDNFVAAPNTVSTAYQLTNSLQQLEWYSSVNPPNDPQTGLPIPHSYVPLFVAMSQDGNGLPGDQILNGLTPLPSEMSIGATWSPDLANNVGTVMGKELAAIGVNMYFGPSLDVLDGPSTSSTNDLGVTVFGGDPYWVSVMGSAYVSGLHAGSQNRLLVVAKHFPGIGNADRSNAEEVATVRKTLDQLKQTELAPFFAVTGNAALAEATTDGLLVSHIRYQGFQGNIRATTRPVSFDGQALSSILSLPQFVSWRTNGGLIVSDDLGTKAVHQFYTTGSDFPARTVARDAFVAGNDLLDLGNIVASDAPDNYSTVLETLDYFSQKYRSDPAFAQSVDASVLRILSLKEHLYGSFNFQTVQTPYFGLSDVGNSQSVTFDVARSSATLLSPSAQELATLLTAPPKVRDRIIFFTDISQVQQCSTCAMQSGLAFDALQSAIVRLYGPQSGNQTSSSFRLSSYSFDDLTNYLAGKSPPYLQNDLTGASWVILSLTGSGRNQEQVIRNFLSGQQDLLRAKHIILFAFGAPYYLDATDISQLTAYYALYSQEPPFVEVAARLLFQELTPLGASPVSIPGLGYDLTAITSPDPNQIIPLILDISATPVSTNRPTPESTPVPLFKIGDTIAIRTGVIKDHNGQPVPDRTVVHFSMNLTGEGGGILQQADSVTALGVARVSFGLDKPGLLQIRATSGPALVSEVLQLDVSSGGQPAAVTVIIPELTPELTPQTAITPQPVENQFVTAGGSPRFIAWLLIILILLAGAILIYFAGLRMESLRWGIRWGLCALAGGLLTYNYVALGMPGSASFATSNGFGGIVLVTMIGLFAGWGAGWLWSQRSWK